MIFDTNVLIYISKNVLRIENLVTSDTKTNISIISYIEALGFSFATDKDRFFMQRICSSCRVIKLSEVIAEETINLRKRYKIKLPDAIIYATALVEGLPLLTNNIKDFTNLDGKVELIDPFNI